VPNSDKNCQQCLSKRSLRPIHSRARLRAQTPQRARSLLDSTVLQQLWAVIRFECFHRWGWPRTHWVGPEHHRKRETYQVCSHCGAEREYQGELAS
jgi:hypothetical protein